MRSPITEEQFDEAFREYRHTARRLEPRDRYNTWTDAFLLILLAAITASDLLSR